MIENPAPAAPTLADELGPDDLVVDLAGEGGPDRPDRLFGIACHYPDGGLPLMFEADDGPLDGPETGRNRTLTPAGSLVATAVREELNGWLLTHGHAEPARLIIRITAPAPWTPAGRRQASQEAREALAALDSTPVPTGAREASKSAAELAQLAAGDTRRKVLTAFIRASSGGLTDDELAVETGIIPNRVATRRKELQDAGLLAATGTYRKTRSNVTAAVHEVTPLGGEVWDLL